jgi:UDP-N-acetylmuramoyl-L-alanyl-D-glutamate--2,6-diaminopimelate ligase
MSLRSLIKRVLPTSIFHKIEPLGHLIEAVIAQTWHGFPARNLKVIGVTGTDGKTSTASLITAMLKHNDYKVAMMTTISIDYGDGRGEQPNPTRLTTIGAIDLAKKLKRIKRAGAKYLVLETTSHALAQHRVVGVPFTIAVITNIHHEHLDYHGTFARYLAAKQKLFKLCNRNHKGLRAGVVNADDPNAKAFTSVVNRPVTYGIESGDLKASDIKLSTSGSHYSASIDGSVYEISCHLPGSFNVYNSMAAVLVGRLLGLKP